MLQSVFHSGGYVSLFLFILLTGCGLPFPEEIAIVSAGVLSAVGKLNPFGAYAACLAGALAGDAVMYGIGYRFGPNLLSLHPKLGRWIGAEREVMYESALQRHGFKMLLLSRFMVGVRGPVYLAAGAVRIPFRQFLMWDLVCATLVVSLFFGLSYRYGEGIAETLGSAERVLTLVVLAIVLMVVLALLRRRRLAPARQLRHKQQSTRLKPPPHRD